MEESLLHQIKRLRKNSKNFQARHFLPELSLNRLMQKKAVGVTLEKLGVKPYHLNELAEEIVQRARKVFAILLLVGQGEAIEVMFKHDSLQKSSLDAKLPFTEDSLENIFSDGSLASDFFERQWEFITPVFFRTLLPRVFENEMILPILDQTSKGEGSFGKVSKYEIHPENHRFPHASQQVSDRDPVS